MTVNTVTWLSHRKQFFIRFKIIFPYCAKRACITSGLLLKGLHSIQAQQCVTWWRRRILNFKSIPPYSWTYCEIKPLFIISNERSHKHTIIMIYYCFHYKFERNPLQIKCSDQFTENKRDTTVLRICMRKIQSLRSM